MRPKKSCHMERQGNDTLLFDGHKVYHGRQSCMFWMVAIAIAIAIAIAWTMLLRRLSCNSTAATPCTGRLFRVIRTHSRPSRL